MTLLRARMGMVALILSVLCIAGGAEAKRLALVVGNGAYQHAAPLDNPANDTREVADALRRLGFEVTLLTDVSPAIFSAVLDAFGKQANGAEAALFYYAGHAFVQDGVNRLVPVSARLDNADTLAAETWALPDILARLNGAETRLVFLDACRTSPVSPAVPGVAAQGLQEFDTETGSFVAFATRPGGVSFDRTGGDGLGPFAKAFLANVEQPGLSVSDLMIRVRNDVETATVGRQVPWDQSSLRAQFYFSTADAAPALAATDDAMPDFEIVDQTTVIGAVPGAAPVPEVAVPQPAPPTIAVAAAEPPAPMPPVQRIGSAVPGRLAAISSETRAAPVPAAQVAPVLAAPGSPDRPVIMGMSPGAAPLLPDAVPAAPEDLPRAMQDELKRMGCYRLAVDGDWGNGSRNALRRYYEVKQAEGEDFEPTVALWEILKKEPDGFCPAPKPQVVRKTAPKATAQRSTTRQATQQPKAAAPAAAPEKKKVTCTFIVVAIVCK